MKIQHYKGVVCEICICVIPLKLISNISESYDAMASMVDVLLCKMYNHQSQVIYKTFENLVIPGKLAILQYDPINVDKLVFDTYALYTYFQVFVSDMVSNWTKNK